MIVMNVCIGGSGIWDTFSRRGCSVKIGEYSPIIYVQY